MFSEEDFIRRRGTVGLNWKLGDATVRVVTDPVSGFLDFYEGPGQRQLTYANALTAPVVPWKDQRLYRMFRERL